MEVDNNENGSGNASSQVAGPSEDLQTILSGARGLLHGMSMDILYVELETKKEDKAINETLLTDLPAGQREWKAKKIEAVVQGMADRLYMADFILHKIGLRSMSEEDLAITEWKMRVDIVD